MATPPDESGGFLPETSVKIKKSDKRLLRIASALMDDFESSMSSVYDEAKSDSSSEGILYEAVVGLKDMTNTMWKFAYDCTSYDPKLRRKE